MKIIDLTEEVEWAKSMVTILPTGVPEEPWEDYVDFKQYRMDYDLALVGETYYKIGKWGLGEEVCKQTKGI